LPKKKRPQTSKNTE
jgi:hypothetical protein